MRWEVPPKNRACGSQEKNHFHNNLKNQGDSKTSKQRLRCRLQHSLGIMWRPQTSPLQLLLAANAACRRGPGAGGPSSQARQSDEPKRNRGRGRGSTGATGSAAADRGGRRPCACLPRPSLSPAGRGGAEGPAGGDALRAAPAGVGSGARGPTRALKLPLPARPSGSPASPARTHQNTCAPGPAGASGVGGL